MFLLCLVFAMFLCASVHMCLVVTCWERADLLALVCGVYLWVCKLSHWYPGSGMVLDCIDSWSLHPFSLCRLARVWWFLIKVQDAAFSNIKTNSWPLTLKTGGSPKLSGCVISVKPVKECVFDEISTKLHLPFHKSKSYLILVHVF